MNATGLAGTNSMRILVVEGNTDDILLRLDKSGERKAHQHYADSLYLHAKEAEFEFTFPFRDSTF